MSRVTSSKVWKSAEIQKYYNPESISSKPSSHICNPKKNVDIYRLSKDSSCIFISTLKILEFSLFKNHMFVTYHIL